MNTYIFKVIGVRISDRKKAFVQASSQAEAVKRFITEFPGHTDEIACEFLFDVQDLLYNVATPLDFIKECKKRG